MNKFVVDADLVQLELNVKEVLGSFNHLTKNRMKYKQYSKCIVNLICIICVMQEPHL